MQRQEDLSKFKARLHSKFQASHCYTVGHYERERGREGEREKGREGGGEEGRAGKSKDPKVPEAQENEMRLWGAGIPQQSQREYPTEFLPFFVLVCLRASHPVA